MDVQHCWARAEGFEMPEELLGTVRYRREHGDSDVRVEAVLPSVHILKNVFVLECVSCGYRSCACYGISGIRAALSKMNCQR